jgi:hypothetical protein
MGTRSLRRGGPGIGNERPPASRCPIRCPADADSGHKRLKPRPYWDPETDAAATTLELAIPLLSEAAGGHVEGVVGDTDPLVAVQQTIERGGFDEIIISTLPARVSRWLRRDLPHRVEALGLPVTVVTAQQSDRAFSDSR